MSYTRRKRDNSAANDLLYKIGGIIIGCVLVVVLVKTGAFFTIRNWISGAYNTSSNAVEQSQQHFGAGLERSREHQGQRAMGKGDSGP